MKQLIKFKLALILILLTSHNVLYSQFNPKTIKVSFVSESVSLPFAQFVISPVHPGISIGTDLMIKDQTSWYKSFGLEAGYYYHKLYEHAILLDAAYKFGYTFNFGFFIVNITVNIKRVIGAKIPAQTILTTNPVFF